MKPYQPSSFVGRRLLHASRRRTSSCVGLTPQEGSSWVQVPSAWSRSLCSCFGPLSGAQCHWPTPVPSKQGKLANFALGEERQLLSPNMEKNNSSACLLTFPPSKANHRWPHRTNAFTQIFIAIQQYLIRTQPLIFVNKNKDTHNDRILLCSLLS